MGLFVIAKDVVFKNYFDTLLALPDGIKIHFDFGDTLAKSAINKITGESAQVVGNPTINANSAIVNNKVGFKLNGSVATTHDRTYIIITKSAFNTILCGHDSYDDAANQPKSTGMAMTNNQLSVHYMSDLAALTPAQTGVGSTVRFFAGTVSGTTIKTYVNSSGTLVEVSATKTQTLTNFFPFSVGAFNVNGTTFPADVETYEVLYADRALTRAEIESLYLALKSKYASKSIVIS